MNNSKTPCIQQISSNTRSNLTERWDNLIKKSFFGDYANTYFTSISHSYSGENVSETVGRIHVFISQTGNNHPEVGARQAGKMVISSFSLN